MIYALLNHKGGVGKTTLAVHIAAALAKRGRRIMLVDADPQGSALDWSASRQAEPLFPVIGLPRPNLHKEIPCIACGATARASAGRRRRSPDDELNNVDPAAI